MKLTSKERNNLPKKDFAVKGGHYPIEDTSHARNALARVSEFGSPSEKAEVRRKVERKYPSIEESKKSVAKKMKYVESKNRSGFPKHTRVNNYQE